MDADVQRDPGIKHDPVDHPSHYASVGVCADCLRPIEAIDVTELLNFNRGNAVKYILRAGKKASEPELQDLEKSRWYLDREIARLRKITKPSSEGRK